MKSITFDIKWLALAAGLVLGMLFSSLIVQAATTISTDIATAGGYTQSGASANTFTGATTLANASTTSNVSIAGALWIGGNATTTSAGALSLQSTLDVLGKSTLANASTTSNVSIAGALWIGGNATTTAAGAISTQSGYTQSGTTANTFTGATTFSAAGTALTVTNDAKVTGNLSVVGTASTTNLKVGVGGSTVANVIFGYCTLSATDVTTASTTYSNCVLNAGIIDQTYRVFVQATSSLPVATVVTAASSTAAGGISVRFWADAGATAVVDGTALNFWAVK